MLKQFCAKLAVLFFMFISISKLNRNKLQLFKQFALFQLSLNFCHFFFQGHQR